MPAMSEYFTRGAKRLVPAYDETIQYPAWAGKQIGVGDFPAVPSMLNAGVAKQRSGQKQAYCYVDTGGLCLPRLCFSKRRARHATGCRHYRLSIAARSIAGGYVKQRPDIYLRSRFRRGASCIWFMRDASARSSPWLGS